MVEFSQSFSLRMLFLKLSLVDEGIFGLWKRHVTKVLLDKRVESDITPIARRRGALKTLAIRAIEHAHRIITTAVAVNSVVTGVEDESEGSFSEMGRSVSTETPDAEVKAVIEAMGAPTSVSDVLIVSLHLACC